MVFTEGMEAFSENLENALNNKESKDSHVELSRAKIANISKGNNLCLVLKGASIPRKEDMEAYTLYVYEKDGKIFSDSKQSKSSPLEITSLLGAENLELLTRRISNPHGNEDDHWNLKDQPMIESIFKASIEKNSRIISRTYRQVSIDTATYLKGTVGKAVGIVDKALYNVPSSFMNQLVLPVTIGAVNVGITVLFGSKKNLPYPSSSTLVRNIDKYMNSARKYINNTWEENKKTSNILYGADVAISSFLYGADVAISSFHTVMNSKALGRATSMATMIMGSAAMTALTGGGFLAAGAAVAAGITVAGARAEMRREDLENKQRYLHDVIASVDKQQNIIKALHDKNPAIDLYKSLNIPEPKLYQAKPKTIEYKVTATNLDAERSIASNLTVNSVALALDIVSGNMHALATKANATVSGALASGISQLSETETKERLNNTITKLEDIAFGQEQPKKNIDELREISKQEIIRAKQLKLAEKDLHEAIANGQTNDLKKIFDAHRTNAEAECQKEWSVETETWNRLKRDKEAMALLEEAQKHGPQSTAAKEFQEKFAEYKEEAAHQKEKSIEAETWRLLKRDKEAMALLEEAQKHGPQSTAAKEFQEKFAACKKEATMVPASNCYNNHSKAFNLLSKIGRCLYKELFSERTSYKKGAVVNHFTESSSYIKENKIVYKYVGGPAQDHHHHKQAIEEVKHVNHDHVAGRVEVIDGKAPVVSAAATPGMEDHHRHRGRD